MTIDKYTKFILTLIAVGIIGINFHLFKGDFVKDAYANSHQVHKIALCDEKGEECVGLVKGKYRHLLSVASFGYK